MSMDYNEYTSLKDMISKLKLERVRVLTDMNEERAMFKAHENKIQKRYSDELELIYNSINNIEKQIKDYEK